MVKSFYFTQEYIISSDFKIKSFLVFVEMFIHKTIDVYVIQDSTDKDKILKSFLQILFEIKSFFAKNKPEVESFRLIC